MHVLEEVAAVADLREVIGQCLIREVSLQRLAGDHVLNEEETPGALRHGRAAR